MTTLMKASALVALVGGLELPVLPASAWGPAFVYLAGSPAGLYDEHPPYFSYTRPVYYSLMDVTAPVGFVYHRCDSADASQAAPLRIRNPFVVNTAGASQDSTGSQPRPLRIRNPYVDSDAAPPGNTHSPH
jgi:hypothetical protein